MIKRHLFATIILLVIVVLSLIPIPEVKPLEGVPFIDKWTHMVMYVALAGAIWIDAIKRYDTDHKWLITVLAIIIPTLIGGALELIQPSVNRSCELLDFIADGVGTVFGSLIGLLVARVYKG